MTDPEWMALTEYVRDRMHDLRLHAWDITVKKDPPENTEAYSTTLIQNESNFATMRFRADFRELDPELQREIVIHELLHCFVDRFANHAGDWIKGGYPEGTFATIIVNIGHEYERMTDAIAMAIADKYPLIDWPPGVPSEPREEKPA